MTESAERLADELSKAVARGEITAQYQPQFDVASMTIVAAETLARWTHPDLGPIPPTVFIPLAEKLGLIDELGDHMIAVACDAARDWLSHGHEIEVAINVSALQLADPEFARRLLRMIEERGLSPRLVTIEVTESKPGGAVVVRKTFVAPQTEWDGKDFGKLAQLLSDSVAALGDEIVGSLPAI